MKEGERDGIISLQEVYATLQDSIWSELRADAKGGARNGSIDQMRRNLQREHLKRVQALLTRGSSALPPDALSLVRFNATQLRDEFEACGGAAQVAGGNAGSPAGEPGDHRRGPAGVDDAELK